MLLGSFPKYSSDKDSKQWQKYSIIKYFHSLSFETRSHDCQPIYCVQWRDRHSPRSNVLISLFIYEFDTAVLFCWKHIIINVFGRIFPQGVGIFKMELHTFQDYMYSEVTFKKKHIYFRELFDILK